MSVRAATSVGNARLDGGDGDRVGFAHVIPCRRHQPCDRAGRGDFAVVDRCLFSATPPGRPLADHPLGTAEAVGFEPSPQFGGVATAAGPLGIEQRQTFEIASARSFGGIEATYSGRGKARSMCGDNAAMRSVTPISSLLLGPWVAATHSRDPTRFRCSFCRRRRWPASCAACR